LMIIGGGDKDTSTFNHSINNRSIEPDCMFIKQSHVTHLIPVPCPIFGHRLLSLTSSQTISLLLRIMCPKVGLVDTWPPLSLFLCIARLPQSHKLKFTALPTAPLESSTSSLPPAFTYVESLGQVPRQSPQGTGKHNH
jgi:hypothetical protein